MTYQPKTIVREDGGSVMRWQNATCAFFASGASLMKEQGGFWNLLNGTVAKDTAYELFAFGSNKFWFASSDASPTLSGSPGDLLLIAQSASTGLWVNGSDGTAGSVWNGVGGATDGSAVGP